MTEIQSLHDLLLLRESEEVEFKEAMGKDRQGELPTNFWETCSAMANTDGGYVFLGVTEKHEQFSFAGLPSTERLETLDERGRLDAPIAAVFGTQAVESAYSWSY